MTRTAKLLTGFVAAIAALAVLVLSVCVPRLEVELDSRPGGASIVVDGAALGKKTPASISVRFPPEGIQDGFACYSVLLDQGAQRARGRILCWDGGRPLYPVFIRRVESDDGSVWTTPFNEQTIRVRFSKPGNFFLVTHWWEKGDHSVNLDGESSLWSTPCEIHELNPGRHRLASWTWEVDMEVDEGFCVQLFEWGSGEDLYLCFEPDQFPRVTIREGEGGTTILKKPGSFLVNQRGTDRLDFEGRDGKKCTLAFTLKGVNPNLHVRVTRD